SSTSFLRNFWQRNFALFELFLRFIRSFMKYNKSVLYTLLLLVVVAALYRVIPNRPFGFAPQLAMALFAGATIKDKKLALVVPVLSMFISDLLYQLLYINHLSAIPGFYSGQWINYLLFASVTFWGF